MAKDPAFKALKDDVQLLVQEFRRNHAELKKSLADIANTAVAQGELQGLVEGHVDTWLAGPGGRKRAREAVEDSGNEADEEGQSTAKRPKGPKKKRPTGIQVSASVGPIPPSY